jgi:transcriptional regulator with XRE-family HTH domain
MKRIAQNLKNLRIHNGFTLTQVSQATGISESSIWNYENGKRSIPAERVIVLANYFNVDITKIMLSTITNFDSIGDNRE